MLDQMTLVRFLVRAAATPLAANETAKAENAQEREAARRDM